MKEQAEHHSASLPPNPSRLIQALRSIGYSLNSAIADLIDNSIDASATKVLVRLVHDDQTISRIIVADDGDGEFTRS